MGVSFVVAVILYDLDCKYTQKIKAKNSIFTFKNVLFLDFKLNFLLIMEKETLKTPFNTAQVEVLQLLAGGLSEEELAELRRVLRTFKFKLISDRAAKIAAAKGWTKEDIDAISYGHRRTPYKSKIEFDRPYNITHS
jgi:hypothetical protein